MGGTDGLLVTLIALIPVLALVLMHPSVWMHDLGCCQSFVSHYMNYCI
jgi:hypothetical protein